MLKSQSFCRSLSARSMWGAGTLSSNFWGAPCDASCLRRMWPLFWGGNHGGNNKRLHFQSCWTPSAPEQCHMAWKPCHFTVVRLSLSDITGSSVRALSFERVPKPIREGKARKRHMLFWGGYKQIFHSVQKSSIFCPWEQQEIHTKHWWYYLSEKGKQARP